MKKILLAACLLTATLTATTTANTQQAVTQDHKKLPPKAQETYINWLVESQITTTSETITKEGKWFRVDYEGTRWDEYSGVLNGRGSFLVSGNGTFFWADWVTDF
jgi:hypothetical protein